MSPLTRRRFLGASLSTLAALRCAAVRAAPLEPPTLLILGGTGFVGPHIVEAALKRGYKVTLFNRGKTNPGMFPQLEKLTGDRGSDLKALEGRKWDAVVDTSGNVPSEVVRSATLLAANVSRYVYVSTVEVYAKLDRIGMDETAALATIADPAIETVTPQTYGALKALSEQAAEQALPGRTIVLRSGVIAGPGDPTDRFTYWPVRATRGGEMLAPGTAQDPTQFIDARDLADFVIETLQRKLAGIYNVDAAPGAITMGKLIDACKRVAQSSASVTWLPAEFLQQEKVAAWTELPLWLPAIGDNAGFGRVSVAKAKSAGLKFRPMDITVRDTLEWWKTAPEERRAALRAGLPPEREAEILKAWHDRQAKP